MQCFGTRIPSAPCVWERTKAHEQHDFHGQARICSSGQRRHSERGETGIALKAEKVRKVLNSPQLVRDLLHSLVAQLLQKLAHGRHAVPNAG